MTNVIHVNFRRQRGFIDLSGVIRGMFIFGIVAGAFGGIALWELFWWLWRHLTWL